MRNLDGTLDGNLNDNLSAKTSGSVTFVQTSSINENLTEYDLLPVVVNRPPIITIPVWEASRPQIVSANTANATGNNLYKFEDGVIKVYIGSTFTLNVGAIQPDTYNVENGIPTIKAPNQDMYYLWRQDDRIIRTYETPSLQSKVLVSGSSIRFERIQPESAGTWVCEISNDIGSVFSEPVTIEVYNPDLDAYFYRNLVQNGSATNGIENWTSNNSEFVNRDFTNIKTTDLKKPNRVDLFGYNMDMMHPRPYQIETGILKNIGYEKAFYSPDSQIRGGYFSRDVYKFEKAGGSFYVKAYQDIDVTEIQDFIRGSIYGINGVRAIFSCYIGNAILNWTPTRELVLPDTKINPENYFLGAPRISLENFLTAGPGKPMDEVYVTLEEYDMEARLTSTILNSNGTKSTLPKSITLKDPWTKAMANNLQKKYYTQDIYNLNTTSKGNWVDAVLWAADELYPDKSERPTHGQYMEFNRVVVERLNPKTNKIRIALNFWTNDWKMFEHLDYELTNSTRIFELIGWEKNYIKNSFDKIGSSSEVDFIRSIIDNDPKYKDKEYTEKWGLCPSPRTAVTGITLSLIPLEQTNMVSTETYTRSALSINNKPKTNVPSSLLPNIKFDPFGLLKRLLVVKFKNKQSTPKIVDGVLTVDRTLTIILKDRKLDTTGPLQKISNTSDSVFPFIKGSPAYAYAENLLEFTSNMENTPASLREFAKVISTRPIIDLGSSKRKNLIQTIKDIKPTFTSITNFVPDKLKRRKADWNNVFRFILYYTAIPSNEETGKQKSTTNSYYLKVDPESETPVLIYRDENLPSGAGEVAFNIKDYQINLDGTMTIELPIELITRPVEQGGLGVPKKPIQIIKVTPAEALDIVKKLKKTNTTTATVNIIFEEWWKSQSPDAPTLGASSFNDAGLENLQEANEKLAAKRLFDDAIKDYFEDKKTINALSVEWGFPKIPDVQIKIEQEMADPNWTVSLYAVRTAPQLGTILTGSPVFGFGLNGEQYTVTYDYINDGLTNQLQLIKSTD